MARTRTLGLGVALLLLLEPPAHAETVWSLSATPSYNPWVAAGLTYAPIALGATPGAIHSDPVYPGLQTFALAVVVNPLPGTGQLYTDEAWRGIGIMAGGAAMLGATVVANIALYRGGRFSQANAASDVDVRPYLNIGYMGLASLYSLWAAYDAYQIAERKNSENGKASLYPAAERPSSLMR
jgi:hypothetical protein